jgi:glucuronoarabinoxylan endo-1,4-beta-xylanase
MRSSKTETGKTSPAHKAKKLFGSAVGMAVAALAIGSSHGCVPSGEPNSSSQTNWFRHCVSDAECGMLECICGACTTLCKQNDDCSDDAGLCLRLSDERSKTFCEGSKLTSPVCVQSCSLDSPCPEGATCKDSICQILPPPDVVVQVDPAARHQVLIGFGASLAYSEGVIVDRPDREELYDEFFNEIGAEALRVTNFYEPGREADLERPAQVIDAARERLGFDPAVFMTSGSPPAALKANGSKACEGAEETCTLATLEDGSFNYAGFAQFWRDSVEAYSNAGVKPTYISIQNNPNWTPPAGISGDACRLIPEEGTMLVGEEGAQVEARFAGYLEAATAVQEALADLPGPPALFGPETTSLNAVPRYEPVFASGIFSAIAIHLYGVDTVEPNTDELNAVRALSSYYALPVVQSEMLAQGLETAALLHHSTVEADAAAYIQNDFVSWVDSDNVNALVQLQETGFVRQGPFYALQHFAKNTAPGWVRVDAFASTPGILASAWTSPNEDALTIILINQGTSALLTELDLGDLLEAFPTSSLSQTTFDTTVTHSDLGALADDLRLEIPARAIITIALEG